MELWNEIITEKSRKLLFELKGMMNFVLIGGWAVWLYSQSIKSKDIDVYIDFDDFFKLQKDLINKGMSIGFNPKLNKYEIKMEEIDIDIYTPNHCNLIVPCKDVFNEKLFKKIDNFDVIIPEALLILKINAEENRHETIKGFKDRIDILSILYKTEINKKLFRDLSKKYNINLKRLDEIIKKSYKEYGYFFPESENLRKLKSLKSELIKKLKSSEI